MTVTSTVSERPLRDYLRITEIMYDPVGGGDYEFIELRNTSGQTLDISDLTFTDGITFAFADSDITGLLPGEYVIVVKDETIFSSRYSTVGLNIAGEYSGSLSNSGETITLQGKWGSNILTLTYSDKRGWPLAADGTGHSLVPLDSEIEAQSDGSGDFGPNWRASGFIHGSPGEEDYIPATTLQLNEICAHTDFSHSSWPDYDSNDWIELYNSSDASVSLNNVWYLSDDKNNLKKWPVTASMIPAGEWISFDEITGFHNPITSGFGLDKAGEQVFLSYLPGTIEDSVVDCVRFKGQPNGSSLSRYPDGGDYWYQTAVTRDHTNAAPDPACVISEIMYHPGAGDKEFIELRNLTSTPLSLWDNDSDVQSGWRLNGGVSYEFSSSDIIPADGFLLLVGFEPNESNLAVFNNSHGTSLTASQVVGPYIGDLSNNTEQISLERPQASDDPIQPNDLSWIIIDEVIYSDQSPWPYGADGTGQSLQRIDMIGSGNNPANWKSQIPSPGIWVSRADFNRDGQMTLADLEILSRAWLSEEDDSYWNALCDLSNPVDGIINLDDFAVFMQFWE